MSNSDYLSNSPKSNSKLATCRALPGADKSFPESIPSNYGKS